MKQPVEPSTKTTLDTQPKQPKEWLNRTVIGVHIQEKVLILPVVL
jgi:hypothetical protein